MSSLRDYFPHGKYMSVSKSYSHRMPCIPMQSITGMSCEAHACFLTRDFGTSINEIINL